MAKSKASGSETPLLASVSKTGRAEIARIVEEQGGGLTLAELLARNWDFRAVLRAFGSEQDVARRVKEQSTAIAAQHSGCTPKQAEEVLPFIYLTQDVRESVIARRFVLDDPAELARGLAVFSRLRWLELAIGGSWGVDGEPVLEAFAARDQSAAARLAGEGASVSRAADGEELGFLDLMTLAVHAAWRGDQPALTDVVERMGKGKSAPWQAGMRQCFAGLARRQPDDVASGLTGYLDGLRKLKRKAPLEDAVSLTAHGFYRLCETADPALVAGFDVASPLPWDAGFHEWTNAHPDPLAGLDLSGISPALHEAVVRLRSPLEC